MVEELALRIEDLKEKIKEALQNSKKRKFEQSVEVIIAIDGLDLKKPENRMLLTIPLPKEIKKKRTICVFADGPFAEEARNIGVDRVITKSELEELSGRKREIKKIANKYDFLPCSTTTYEPCW